MKTRLAFTLLVCFITSAAGQPPVDWAKKDTRQMSASYMLRVSYEERGWASVWTWTTGWPRKNRGLADERSAFIRAIRG